MGKHQKAIRIWQMGLDAATKYRVLYEDGLLRVRLGSALRNVPAEQLLHFECAAQIFSSMGAARDLETTRSLAKESGFKI
ncbi:MAG: hypothetical protein ACM3PS_00380, partial [Syntrophothermus sp.]